MTRKLSPPRIPRNGPTPQTRERAVADPTDRPPSDDPIAACYVDEHGQVLIPECPYCGREHVHGLAGDSPDKPSFGHRHRHCGANPRCRRRGERQREEPLPERIGRYGGYYLINI